MDCIDFRQTPRNPISETLSSNGAVGRDRNARESASEVVCAKSES
jgi:hypothetical protein